MPSNTSNMGLDVIVRGEGEYTLAELLPAIAKTGVHRLHDIAGIAFIDETGRMVETAPRPLMADLSAHPWPDRESYRHAAVYGYLANPSWA